MQKNKCKLRKWKLEDADDLSRALNNPKILANLRDGLPYPYTQADAKSYIELMLNQDEMNTFAFAIEYEHKVLGSIGAFRQQNIHSHTAEMGYYLHEDYWNKGIMTDAVLQLCEFIFHNTDIIRIYAEPFETNQGSCTVLEKAGFSFEGTLHSHALKNGKLLNMRLYARIKEQ